MTTRVVTSAESGYQESNLDYLLPKQARYRYTIAR